ncbi:putative glycolipid-binding domain-containing protein [Microbacterium lushaniae]|nr:putative glycolipid-binding domain-containing protein [Microbacterium lushaniae]KAA9155737.1 putative glycolipid-binding domain-containing protein [Microbacterium lushaniae]
MRIMWQGVQAPSMERLAFVSDEEGLFAASEVRTPDRSYSYDVAMEEDWTFRTLEAGGGGMQLLLERTADGSWLYNGQRRPDLAEATDIDLSFTPFTNTLPIRRLALAVGCSADIVTAFVAPDLTVTADPQRYTRVDDRRYLYESRDSDFEREITVDDDGFVVEYPGLFRRLPV